MSVVNILNHGSSIHVYTDGGLFDAAGNVSAIVHKQHVIPHLNAVLASRGSWEFTAKVAAKLGCNCSDFDSLIDNAARLYWNAFNDTLPDAAHELWIAGYSPRRGRCEGYAVSTVRLQEQHHDVDGAPFELVMLPPVVIVPHDRRFNERLADFPQRTPEELGVAIVECQRQLRGTSPIGVETTSVAGFIQHSVITACGINTKILKRFPDEVGKCVFPSKDMLVI